MIINIDQKDLETKWAKRKLDLFPFFYSLKVLLLSRESYLIDVNKRLRESDPATWIQFLSSDDEKISELAKGIIQEERTKKEDIIPLILFSLDKIKKESYPKRLAETLIDYDIVFSMGYILGYLFIRPDLKDMVFKIVSKLGREGTKLYQENGEYEVFMSNVFDAIGEDIGQRIGKNKKIQNINTLLSINDELEIIIMLYIQETNTKHRNLIEKEISYLGSNIISSLHEIKFSYDSPDELYLQLKKVIPYMGMFRLKDDINFLNKLKPELDKDNLKPELDEDKIETEDDDEIMLLIDLSLKLIQKNNISLFETVSRHDNLFFPAHLKGYIE